MNDDLRPPCLNCFRKVGSIKQDTGFTSSSSTVFPLGFMRPRSPALRRIPSSPYNITYNLTLSSSLFPTSRKISPPPSASDCQSFVPSSLLASLTLFNPPCHPHSFSSRPLVVAGLRYLRKGAHTVSTTVLNILYHRSFPSTSPPALHKHSSSPLAIQLATSYAPNIHNPQWAN